MIHFSKFIYTVFLRFMYEDNIFHDFDFEYLSHQYDNISLSTLYSVYQFVDAFRLVLPVH